MTTSPSEKAAKAVADGASRVDFNEYLFAGYLMGQPYNIQQRIVEVFVVFLQTYQRDAKSPGMQFRTNTETSNYIRDHIDLTDFDH